MYTRTHSHENIIIYFNARIYTHIHVWLLKPITHGSIFYGVAINVTLT